jgi:hypothetical protein
MTRTIRFVPILLAPMLLPACSGPGDDDPDLDLDEGCPPMFVQDILPEYHIEIAPAEWAAMQDEFRNRVEREEAGEDIHPYHPVEFRYVAGSERLGPVPDVLLRLKGQSSWLQTIDLDDDPKMQFVIAFNEVDRKGRFLGVRKIELDMPRTDYTFLRQRVALSYLREAGLPAQCANNARLYINGTYYGLYTNLERLDKEFLQRSFPGDADGDLWKSGRIIRTNDDSFRWDRLEALWSVGDFASFGALVDLDASIYEWAAEAMIGHADGYYNGRANFFLYDHPARGFIWLAHDLDTALAEEFLLPDATPVFPACVARWERDWHHYLLTMHDPAGLEMYVQALADARSRYDVGAMQRRIDRWAAQIGTAAAEDPRKPFTMEEHHLAVAQMRSFAATRAAYLDEWLACRRSSGVDADGDGFDMCHDCNDNDPTVYPGAPETCNLRDDNCDGRIDRVDGISVCE